MNAATARLAEFAVAEHVLPGASSAAVAALLNHPDRSARPPSVDDDPLATYDTDLWARWAAPTPTLEALLVASGVDRCAEAADAGNETGTGAGTGERVMAIAVGVEAVLRLRAVLGESLRAEGWDPTGVSVVCGVALAAARILKLTPVVAARALSIACTQAAGGTYEYGTPVAGFQWTRAVLNGIEAARLAELGATAPSTGIEGKRGLVALQAPGADPDAIVAGLGHRWLLDGLVVDAIPTTDDQGRARADEGTGS